MEKNNRCLVDSSVILALFNPEDGQHHKAIEKFKKIRSEKLIKVISCVTIMEVVSVLKYKKIECWQKYCEKLVDGSLFVVDNAYFFDMNDLSWNLVMKKEKIGMVDAIEIEHCIQNDEQLITFDRAQEREYQKLVG